MKTIITVIIYIGLLAAFGCENNHFWPSVEEELVDLGPAPSELRNLIEQAEKDPEFQEWMKALNDMGITLDLTTGMATYTPRTGSRYRPEERQQFGQACNRLAEAFRQIDQQHYYNSQPQIIYCPGQQGFKLESWRYGGLPSNYVLPSQNPNLFPGRRQENSTYWQERNAKDEYWQRHFGFSIP